MFHSITRILNTLKRSQDNTPLKNLRASIKYLDELALDDGDALQNERRKVSLAMLKEVLAKVEGEIEGMSMVSLASYRVGSFNDVASTQRKHSAN